MFPPPSDDLLVPDPADARLVAVLGSVAAYAVLLDATGDVRWVNDALLDAAGWARTDLVGAEWGEAFVTTGCPTRALVSAALRGTAGRAEGELVTRDGASRWVAWDVVPLSDAAGHPEGAVCLGYDVTAAREAGRDRARLSAALAAQADADPLTGLLNARGLARTAAHALRVAARTHRTDAVLVVRLTTLAAARAAHGPAAADDAVCAVAEALRGVVRDSDLVARIGDDLFAVYAVGTGWPDHAASTARRLRVALAVQDDAAHEAGRLFDLGCAVGGAERGPGEGLDVLLARAAAAADEAARAGADAEPGLAEPWAEVTGEWGTEWGEE